MDARSPLAHTFAYVAAVFALAGLAVGAEAAGSLGSASPATAPATREPAPTTREPAIATRAPASTPHNPAPVPNIQWATCADGSSLYDCATVSVPLDYDHPDGDQTFLALARIPASDPAHKIGTLFLNPGGPASSGVGLVQRGFGELIHTLLQGRFDVVGFDPRGVRGSDPLQCFESFDEERNVLFSQPIFPYLPEQEGPFFDAYRSLGDRCLTQGGRIATHMSTADVARDMDLLRRAVGDERLSYLGFSYGSYIGNTYANLFPGKVRALVIDGVLDPRLWSSGWNIRSARVATAVVLEEFLRLCDEAAADCALSAPGGASARFFALANALRDHPYVFEDGVTYRYTNFIEDSAIAMYTPESWGGPDGFAVFFASLADAVLGNASAARSARATRHSLETRLSVALAAPYNNFRDAYYGIQCSDIQYPRTLAAFHAISEYAERGSIFGPYWWWKAAGCANYPVSSDRYVGPWTARTSAPVLIVGNFFDPATDYAGAVASSKLLKNSRLLSYAGWGHTAFGLNDCVTAHVVSYLLDGTLPPANTVCPAGPNPFLPTLARRPTARGPWIGVPPMRELPR